MTSKNKNNETKVAQFLKNTTTLRSTIAKQFEAMESVEVQYQSAVAQLGKSLLQLKAACKGLVTFKKAVTDPGYGVNIPFRSAKRYMNLVRRMNGLSPNTVARIITAGYDPASQRVLEVVENLGNSRINRMCASTLAEKLRKTAARTKPRSAKKIMDAAIDRYVISLAKSGLDYSEIKAKLLKQVNSALTPQVVRDLQHEEEETQAKAA